MKRMLIILHALLLLSILATSTTTVAAKGSKSKSSYQTGFFRWRSADGDFAGWTTSGAALDSDGNLTLDLATAVSETDPYAAGAYYGGNFYNGGSYQVGEATSPVMTPDFSFNEAIASWNADTPVGAWIETLFRVQLDGRWTKWYNLGVWASGSETIQRHSVRLQGDSDGYVAVDTFVLSDKKATLAAYQLKFRLFSADGVVVPSLHNASLAYSTSPDKVDSLQPGNSDLWNTLLDVPECSQMVYTDGGEVWCSPTSTSMVLGYYGASGDDCETRVRAAVAGVYDWIYGGTGNWPFNTAYAASLGFEGYVARFTSLAQAEPWVAAGVPVIFSFGWGKNELTNAPVPSSGGHLAVLVGFDADGNPIVNDPAAAADEDVRRTYLREELEPLWLERSGGTVYLIYPAGAPVPDL